VDSDAHTLACNRTSSAVISRDGGDGGVGRATTRHNTAGRLHSSVRSRGVRECRMQSPLIRPKSLA